MTTKHHGGFALWPSAVGNFNTGTHLGGRDLVQDFVTACRLGNLRHVPLCRRFLNLLCRRLPSRQRYRSFEGSRSSAWPAGLENQRTALVDALRVTFVNSKVLD
jgi:hypothetical protein